MEVCESADGSMLIFFDESSEWNVEQYHRTRELLSSWKARRRAMEIKKQLQQEIAAALERSYSDLMLAARLLGSGDYKHRAVNMATGVSLFHELLQLEWSAGGEQERGEIQET